MSPDHQKTMLGDGRLHLQHGPIDLIIEAVGDPRVVRQAYVHADSAFEGLLQRLADELPTLRRPLADRPPPVEGPVARRMVAAVWPHRKVFVTPMAAVAGAVADTVLTAMVEGLELKRAYINNGGDIAIHLADGERFRMGVFGAISDAASTLIGVTDIDAASPVRGVATSGRGGRSLTMGIADAVTVLARNAAAADAAATLIANAVDLDHPSIERAPANRIDEDSDLGDRPVTIAVGSLSPHDAQRALAAGMAVAEAMRGVGLIAAASLSLQGEVEISGPLAIESHVGADPGTPHTWWQEYN